MIANIAMLQKVIAKSDWSLYSFPVLSGKYIVSLFPDCFQKWFSAALSEDEKYFEAFEKTVNLLHLPIVRCDNIEEGLVLLSKRLLNDEQWIRDINTIYAFLAQQKPKEVVGKERLELMDQWNIGISSYWNNNSGNDDKSKKGA